MKAWIQSTSLYLQISGWPPNQPDWPTLHSLKLSQRHCSKLHAEYYISLMILPRSPDSVSLSVHFFSVALSRSLSLLFLLLLSLPQTIYFCLCLWQSVLGMKAKHIKEQYFWRSRGWILTFCNQTMISNAAPLLPCQWSAKKCMKPEVILPLSDTL